MHVYGVGNDDGVGSQKKLLAQSHYCKQTRFISMWDYLWTDYEIVQLLVVIAEHRT